MGVGEEGGEGSLEEVLTRHLAFPEAGAAMISALRLGRGDVEEEGEEMMEG